MSFEGPYKLHEEIFEVRHRESLKLVVAAEKKVDEMPVIESLLDVIKEVHPPTYEHCLRVGEVASRLTDDADQSGYLFVCGVLHDIGKSYRGIPRILDIADNLTDDQFQLVKNHSLYGAEIVLNKLNEIDNTAERRRLMYAAFVAQYHHEELETLRHMHSDGHKGVTGLDHNELEYALYLTSVIHLVDQVDARSDVSRPYLLAEKSRRNKGVYRKDDGLIVQPSVLWSEITREFYGESESYEHREFAKKLFNIRFGDR